MAETGSFLKIFRVLKLYNFHLNRRVATSLLTSGRKEPMASLKGY